MDLSALNNLKQSQIESDPTRSQLNGPIDPASHEDYDKHLIGVSLGTPTLVYPVGVSNLGKSPFVAREDHTHDYGGFPDGSVALPSISFASDIDTGIFRNSANVIGFSAGGARRAYISTTALGSDTDIVAAGTIYADGGSAGAPGFRFNNVTNSGMRCGATGNLAFSVAGVTLVTVTPTGISTSQWHRCSAGSTGLYNDAHGIGVYFTDADWIRNLGGTGFYAAGVNGHAGASATGSMTGWSNLVRSNSTGTYAIFTSSRKIKRQIKPIQNASEIIDKLTPVTFKEKIKKDDSKEIRDWKDKDLQFGLIAEDVAEVNPHLASYDEDLNPQSWDQSGVLSVVLASLKETREELKEALHKIRKLEDLHSVGK